MLFKNILLGLGGTGIIGGASVGIYYGIKGEEKSTKNSPEDKVEKEEDKNGKSEGGDNSAVSSDTDKEKQQ